MSIELEEMHKTLKRECSFVRNLKKLALKNETEHDRMLRPKTKSDRYDGSELRSKKATGRYGSSMGHQVAAKKNQSPRLAANHIKGGKPAAAAGLTPRKRTKQ